MVVFKFLIFPSIIIFIGLKSIHSQRFEDVPKLVRDLIENEHVPSILWAKTCWRKIDDLNFVRIVHFPVQIVKFNCTINLPNDENTNKQWFFVDMNCDSKSEFLSTIEEKYFAHPYRWIMANAHYDSIQHLAFLPDSNIIIVNQKSNSSQYVLKQAYKIRKEAPLILEDFGLWSRNGGLIDLRTIHMLSRRRRNLQGHLFKASTVFLQEGSENNTDLDDYHLSKVDSLSKISLEITKHWVESVNATMVVDVHRTWGYKDSNTGFFTGMVGQLQRKEADIGGTSLFITNERIAYIEFLSMEISTAFAFVLRSPPISYVSNIYYLPFTGLVWICSIALVALCTIVIALTLKFRLMPDEGTANLGVLDYILFAIASICQMGSHLLTKIMSARISLFILFVALLFLYTSYTANIVALLQSTTKSIRTISDLQNPAIEIGVHDTPYNRHYFKIENEPTRKRLYETKIIPPDGSDTTFMNMSCGISRMREGMFAFHTEINPAYLEVERTFFEHEKCGIVEIKFFSMAETWAAIQKRSPYKEILKVSIMKIREHGIQTRERGRVYRNRPTCGSDGKNFGSIRLNDCYAALLIFVYGFLASFLIFGIETLFGTKMFKNCSTRIKHIIILSETE